MFQLTHQERQVETNDPKLTYESLLNFDGVGQVYECLYSGAATRIGAGCHILEADSLFQMKNCGLGDRMRWGHFGPASAWVRGESKGRCYGSGMCFPLERINVAPEKTYT